jgi:hypothetical protein
MYIFSTGTRHFSSASATAGSGYEYLNGERTASEHTGEASEQEIGQEGRMSDARAKHQHETTAKCDASCLTLTSLNEVLESLMEICIFYAQHQTEVVSYACIHGIPKPIQLLCKDALPIDSAVKEPDRNFIEPD